MKKLLMVLLLMLVGVIGCGQEGITVEAYSREISWIIRGLSAI